MVNKWLIVVPPAGMVGPRGYSGLCWQGYHRPRASMRFLGIGLPIV